MKLSDALRGAADRAPVEQMHVSTAHAAGRVKRERALRMGANGLVGVGAAAVVAVGAIGPLGVGTSDESASDAAAMGGADLPEMAAEDSAGGAAGTRLAEQWMCGTEFAADDGAWAWGDSSGVTYTVSAPEVDGSEIWLPSTLEASRPVDLISGSDYVVTWDGIVVGRSVNDTPIQYGPADEPMLPEEEVYERLDPATEFSTLEQSTQLDPVNCWDGAPLPAGDYEVHQAWTLAYADDAADPAAPTEPTAEPDASIDGDGTASEGDPASNESSASSDDALPAPAMPELFRVAAEPLDLTIDGEPVDDPFAAYLDGDTPVEPVPLPEPIDPEPLPDGYLTPDVARQMFEANRVDGAWDMAPGSQRWVKVNDSASSGDDWTANFFGCSWDGKEGASFPATSAVIDLLSTDVDLPARIDVSYGFVVDGNPLVSSTVKNASEYTIPGQVSPQPQLFLVKDGRVVAEGFPVSLRDEGIGIARTAEGGDAATDMMIAPSDGGALEPGQSLEGEFLWRDINGCYSESGRTEVEPGTYTVLTMQSLSLSSAYPPVYYEDPQPLPELNDSALVGPDTGDTTLGGVPREDFGFGGGDSGAAGFSELTIDGQIEPDITIAPAPDQGEWLELQAWTSLGTINVSAS
ncbi:hypothetical protein [Demequina aestuarii]|uniref:hypothetical protein n=1 Tax=Demequina aestuarii TaxID=327095 RepID=UPI000785DC81|nr:hypothetical protein [Demequina aestuarii]